MNYNVFVILSCRVSMDGLVLMLYGIQRCSKLCDAAASRCYNIQNIVEGGTGMKLCDSIHIHKNMPIDLKE